MLLSDYEYLYRITKHANAVVDTPALIGVIRKYIQENPIYFHQDLNFVQGEDGNGVLIFSIVGTKDEQRKFIKTIHKVFALKLKCKLTVIKKRKFKKLPLNGE